jgi:putative transposase
VKFAWIQAEKAHYPVRKLCRWLAVTPSGFYAWRQRPASARATRDRRLTVLVQASFDASHERYGSPRIHEDLLEQDERVSRKRVIRLMQEQGLKARVRKRFKQTTMSDHDLPIAANLLVGNSRPPRQISAGSATRPSSPSVRVANCIWPRSSICTPGSSSAGPSVR